MSEKHNGPVKIYCFSSSPIGSHSLPLHLIQTSLTFLFMLFSHHFLMTDFKEGRNRPDWTIFSKSLHERLVVEIGNWKNLSPWGLLNSHGESRSRMVCTTEKLKAPFRCFN